MVSYADSLAILAPTVHWTFRAVVTSLARFRRKPPTSLQEASPEAAGVLFSASGAPHAYDASRAMQQRSFEVQLVGANREWAATSRAARISVENAAGAVWLGRHPSC